MKKIKSCKTWGLVSPDGRVVNIWPPDVARSQIKHWPNTLKYEGFRVVRLLVTQP